LENGTIDDYLQWLETFRSCSVSTRNQRKAAIAAFAKYAMKKYFSFAMAFASEVSNIDTKKSKPTQFSYFTKEEISIILSLPKNSSSTEIRNKTILSFLYGSGARAQELCDLTVNDIRFGKSTSVRLNGKGNKSRVVIIPEMCAALLQNYLKLNHFDERDKKGLYVFPSHTNPHMTISCVEAIVSKYVKLAKANYPSLFNEKSYSPHSFRHSIATHMLEAEIPLPVIKVFLGHSSIKTTMGYTTVSDELKDYYLKNREIVNLEITKKEYSVKDELLFLKKQ
jgi:site-specific recombinase XerD